MKCVLVTGDIVGEEMVIGPFDNPDDAISYAVNVLNSDCYSVEFIQLPMTAANARLLERITA